MQQAELAPQTSARLTSNPRLLRELENYLRFVGPLLRKAVRPGQTWAEVSQTLSRLEDVAEELAHFVGRLEKEPPKVLTHFANKLKSNVLFAKETIRTRHLLHPATAKLDALVFGSILGSTLNRAQAAFQKIEDLLADVMLG